ncbi:hypothetical protein ABZX92_08405 [Lentzea sp. NPDC006480]|uniref:hypothetical protein n=1 Tax=Lentzea sp. NPDC006480 TaxID=3157176 RepID=UPI0033A1AFFE
MPDEPQIESAEPEATSADSPFQLSVQKDAGPGTGPDWSGTYPVASLRRIRAAATTEEAGVQATTEAVILLHSIRRILMWMLVIIPIVATAVIIVLVVGDSAESKPCTSIYSCR